MADPITMGALTGIGSGVSALSTLVGGSAADTAGQAAQAAGMRGKQAADYQASATEAAGEAARQAKEFEAKQYGMQAQESRAGAQRTALEKRREVALLESKLLARTAAGGGGTADPTILDLSGDIAQRGEYEALFEMFRGENKARGLEDTAMGARMTGDAALAEARGKATGLRMEGRARAEEGAAAAAAGKKAKSGSYLSALGTIVGGAGSAYGQIAPALRNKLKYG